MEELFFELKQKVYEKLDINLDVSDEDLYKVIDVCIYEISQHRAISVHNRELLRQQLYNSIKRLDILQELLEDDDITEIMINGYKDIFIEKKGRITKWNKQFESREKLEDIAQRIAAMSNKTINEAIPIVDTRLADGSRKKLFMWMRHCTDYVSDICCFNGGIWNDPRTACIGGCLLSNLPYYVPPSFREKHQSTSGA